jgi:fructosamine-3-kinase
MDNLDVFFEDVKGSIKPSVLHGDLWSGNIAGVEGQPSVFDPATYYGHHEAEFGMSWCAGEAILFPEKRAMQLVVGVASMGTCGVAK